MNEEVLHRSKEERNILHTTKRRNFDVSLTVHLSIFISVINQLDAQNFCFTISSFMPLHVSSTCDHHEEVKIALHSLWYPLCTRRPPIGVMIPEAV